MDFEHFYPGQVLYNFLDKNRSSVDILIKLLDFGNRFGLFAGWYTHKLKVLISNYI